MSDGTGAQSWAVRTASPTNASAIGQQPDVILIADREAPSTCTEPDPTADPGPVHDRDTNGPPRQKRRRRGGRRRGGGAGSAQTGRGRRRFGWLHASGVSSYTLVHFFLILCTTSMHAHVCNVLQQRSIA